MLKVIDEIEEKPDILILDPPRDGIHPKALPKLIAYGVDRIVYVSCKPTSLARDMAVFNENGYYMEKRLRLTCFLERQTPRSWRLSPEKVKKIIKLLDIRSI